MRTFLLDLQERIVAALEALEPERRFGGPDLSGERGGLARPRLLEGGAFLERAAVNCSHTRGARLPAPALSRRDALEGRPFEAVSLSLIVHPRNPHAPTTHMNLRLFLVEPDVWWFGGGYDLTPCYGYEEDVRHWHTTARDAVGPARYAAFKAACDLYFRLPHRDEPRGVGGIFFDEFDEGGFDASLDLVRRVGDSFLPAYLPLLERRRSMPYGERERDWQRYRRGRYVEFNLLYDRGTQHGLKAGGRTESILSSLPPEAAWRAPPRLEPGSPEALFVERFLVARDWIA
jgi:coproporphyrinogen III oxidase